MKPNFEDINYNSDVICWGHGNNLVGPNLIASIRLKPESKKEIDARKKDIEAAKKIYTENINRGAKFIPKGDNAIKGISAKIIFINSRTNTITWIQELTEKQTQLGYKPASGRWNISAVIKMVKESRIEFLK